MKARELRKKSIEELEISLREMREKLFQITYQHRNKQLDDTHQRMRLKREIARHITIIKEIQDEKEEEKVK